MRFWNRNRAFSSHVLVIDALGFSQQIKQANEDRLLALWQTINQQYLDFRSKVPHTFMIVSKFGVWGTREFETLRLNDMFILYSRRSMRDSALRYLISTSLLYQGLLLQGFVPRGGLGYGPIVADRGLLIGKGFIDAYEYSEKRTYATRNVCAVEISPDFLRTVPKTQKSFRLLCFYKGAFFVHPYCLIDPDLGQFDSDRVIKCLQAAHVNEEKLAATKEFLEEFEDFDAALLPESASKAFLAAHGFPFET